MIVYAYVKQPEVN